MIQVQIQALLVAIEGGTIREIIRGPNTESNIEVAKLPVFSGEVEKIGGFITVYRLYLRIKMRGVAVEE